MTPASPAKVAAWLAALGGDLERQRQLGARITGLRPPEHGYLLLACCATTGRSKIYAAVRSGPRGPELVALRRRVGFLATLPDEVHRFLAEASVTVDGIAHTDDAGLDDAGGVFRAQPFVCGIDLAQVLAILAQHHAAAPAEIAVAVISAAARALQRALSLPARSGPIDVIGEDLAPSRLRIAIDGRPVWTSLGVAPSADFLAPRRALVPLTTVAGLALDGVPRPPDAPLIGRSVVVPRSTAAASPATIPPSSPRPRRLRWWF